MASLASKRKREANDMPQARAGPGMNAHDFEQQYGLNDDDGMAQHANDMAFSTLASHNANVGEPGDLHQDHGDMHAHAHPHMGHQPGQSASDTAAAAMAQYHTMTVPQSTEQSFLNQANEQGGDRPANTTLDQGGLGDQQRAPSFGDFDPNGSHPNLAPAPNGAGSPTGKGANHGQGNSKPQVGTEEWHKVRRDNHKEVERRRRETINEGINELAKIVPGCEKNKGSILARAVQFITQLKENETQNIEKWTLEKLLTEQAIAELSSSCDKLKAECQRAWAECEQWKKAAQSAGVSIDVDDEDVNAGDEV
ncbi:hypothetical protein BST61_g821 [Cercospora zeina]